MTAFVAIAAIMTALALALVARPLLAARRERADVERAQSNLAILRAQRAELDADLQAGTLSEAQHREALAELERRALEEARPEAGEKPARPPGGVGTVVALAVAIPLAAGLLYWRLGTPLALAPEAQGGAAHAGAERREFTREEIDAMIARVEERLAKAPDDAQGWAVLARTYYTLERFPEAVRAFAELARLMPDDADVLADYADALAMAQGRNLAGKPMELVERALRADPKNWKALALAGSDAMNRKDYAAALGYWERLAAVVPPGSEMAQAVQANIAEAREAGGIRAPRAAAPARASGRVSGTVRLAPNLAAQASPEDTVFIFARPAQGGRMPLAILRKQVKDLPVSFSLDDSMAMAANMKLSDFTEVVVGARVAKGGTAASQPGDLEGFSAPVKVGGADVAVVIDRVVP